MPDSAPTLTQRLRAGFAAFMRNSRNLSGSMRLYEFGLFVLTGSWFGLHHTPLEFCAFALGSLAVATVLSLVIVKINRLEDCSLEDDNHSMVEALNQLDHLRLKRNEASCATGTAPPSPTPSATAPTTTRLQRWLKSRYLRDVLIDFNLVFSALWNVTKEEGLRWLKGTRLPSPFSWLNRSKGHLSLGLAFLVVAVLCLVYRRRYTGYVRKLRDRYEHLQVSMKAHAQAVIERLDPDHNFKPAETLPAACILSQQTPPVDQPPSSLQQHLTSTWSRHGLWPLCSQVLPTLGVTGLTGHLLHPYLAGWAMGFTLLVTALTSLLVFNTLARGLEALQHRSERRNRQQATSFQTRHYQPAMTTLEGQLGNVPKAQALWLAHAVVANAEAIERQPKGLWEALKRHCRPRHSTTPSWARPHVQRTFRGRVWAWMIGLWEWVSSIFPILFTLDIISHYVLGLPEVVLTLQFQSIPVFLVLLSLSMVLASAHTYDKLLDHQLDTEFQHYGRPLCAQFLQACNALQPAGSADSAPIDQPNTLASLL